MGQDGFPAQCGKFAPYILIRLFLLLIRPLSGSAALALGIELMARFGPDLLHWAGNLSWHILIRLR